MIRVFDRDMASAINTLVRQGKVLYDDAMRRPGETASLTGQITVGNRYEWYITREHFNEADYRIRATGYNNFTVNKIDLAATLVHEYVHHNQSLLDTLSWNYETPAYEMQYEFLLGLGAYNSMRGHGALVPYINDAIGMGWADLMEPSYNIAQIRAQIYWKPWPWADLPSTSR